MRLATVLQTLKSSSWHLQRSCKRQKVFRSICSIPANTKKFFEAFAAFLQTPKKSSGHLQHSCKHQKVLRGICSIPANTKKFFGAFAAFLQTPKNSSRHLQRSCKHQKVFRGSCSVAANVSKNTLAVRALYQRHAQGIRRLILSSNSRCISNGRRCQTRISNVLEGLSVQERPTPRPRIMTERGVGPIGALQLFSMYPAKLPRPRQRA